jgi:hypothetical protein
MITHPYRIRLLRNPRPLSKRARKRPAKRLERLDRGGARMRVGMLMSQSSASVLTVGVF